MPLSKIVANSITDNTITTDQIADTSVHGRRNLIINGKMQVAQKGTSLQIVGSSGPTFLDRFETAVVSDATVTVSQDSTVPTGQGFTKSAKLVVNTADSSLSANQHNLFQQKIEGNVGQHLMWGTSDAKKCTVSFWIRSSLTGSFTYYAIDGNAGSQSYVAPFTISAADTWEKKTITIPGPTTGGTTDFPQGTSRMLYTGFNLGVGSNHQTSTVNAWHDPSGSWASTRSSDVQFVSNAGATLYITGWQFEVGEIATPFEHRSFGEELTACQRYFFREGNVGEALHYVTVGPSPNQLWYFQALPVQMRADPTDTIYADNSQANSGKCRRDDNTLVSISGSYTSQDTIGFLITNSTTNNLYFHDFDVDAEL
tara:strand:+ start:276 stop:1382 length:1107 start_codon:yes stop_codon:yes gene_type:complete